MLIAGAIIFREQGAARLGLDPQQLKEVGGDARPLDSFGVASVSQVCVPGAEGREPLESLILISVVYEFGECERPRVTLLAYRPNPDESVRGFKGQLAKQDSIH